MDFISILMVIYEEKDARGLASIFTKDLPLSMEEPPVPLDLVIQAIYRISL